MPIHKATIMPRGNSLGMVSMLPEDDSLNMTRRQFLASMDVAMAGRCSEEIVFGAEDVTSGASSDFENATNMARNMVIRLGMGDMGQLVYAQSNTDYSNLSSETREKIEVNVRRLIDESYQRARDMLTENRGELERLANALLEYETLNRDEIERAVNGLPIGRDILPESGGMPPISEKKPLDQIV